NHLDLEMRQALTMALQNFEGAIVVVSHDRHLLRNTVDDFWLVCDGTVGEYDGDLEDYERWLADRRKDDEAPPQRQVIGEEGGAGTESGAATLTADERKARKREEAAMRKKLSPFRKQQASLETQMEKLQEKLSRIEQALADPGLYEDASKIRLKELLGEQAELKGQLEETEINWLDVSETVEEMEAELSG
ncbi:MAG: ABC transporter ATP-binding protein, partial [Marinobacter sp.]|nr:ABC transporter ATP-binding protein [Marinobacter sp.]